MLKSNKPVAKAITGVITPSVTEAFDSKEYDALELKLEQMKESKLEQDFLEWDASIKTTKEIERKFGKAVGDPTLAHRKLILFAATHAGEKGIALAELRRFISEPNHLNTARESLLKPKDEDGNELSPLIREARGENNELRVFIVEEEAPEA